MMVWGPLTVVWGAGNASDGDVDSGKTKLPDSSDDSDIDPSTTESVRYEYFLQVSDKSPSHSHYRQPQRAVHGGVVLPTADTTPSNHSLKQDGSSDE